MYSNNHQNWMSTIRCLNDQYIFLLVNMRAEHILKQLKIQYFLLLCFTWDLIYVSLLLWLRIQLWSKYEIQRSFNFFSTGKRWLKRFGYLHSIYDVSVDTLVGHFKTFAVVCFSVSLAMSVAIENIDAFKLWLIQTLTPM